jgi:hypothetical protein
MPDPDPSDSGAPKFTLVVHERYLEALMGAGTQWPVIKRQLQELLIQLKERRPERLLLDLRSVTPVNWTTLDRYELGVLASQLTGHVSRVSCLAAKEFIDPQKFGARVAQNRGLKVEVFSDDVAALRWLLEA